MREVLGSIPSQGPRHTKDVIKMVPAVPLFSNETGPPALEASTLPLGYRGGFSIQYDMGTCIFLIFTIQYDDQDYWRLLEYLCSTISNLILSVAGV